MNVAGHVSTASQFATHKDVVTALLAASAGLAGLALVFLGLLIPIVVALRREKSANKLVNRYNQPALAILANFVIGMSAVAAAVRWMTYSTDHAGWYHWTIWLFVGQAGSLVVVAVWAALMVILPSR